MGRGKKRKAEIFSREKAHEAQKNKPDFFTANHTNHTKTDF